MEPLRPNEQHQRPQTFDNTNYDTLSSNSEQHQPLSSSLPTGFDSFLPRPASLSNLASSSPTGATSCRSPLGGAAASLPGRSECLAGMDMLNDMFQRQARRLESQIYERAQYKHIVEQAQAQVASAKEQVRLLEEHHVQNVARIQQSSKMLQQFRDEISRVVRLHDEALGALEVAQADRATLHGALASADPAALAQLELRGEGAPSAEVLRARAAEVVAAVTASDKSSLMQVSVTPSTSLAMTSECNPLCDLSAVADFESEMPIGATPRRGA